MIKRLILSLLFAITSTYASSENFNWSVDELISNDFNIVGLTYIEKSKTIRFNNVGLIYSPGKNKMSEEFKNNLESLYPQYLDILLNYKDEIENIYIKGHSSSENRNTLDIEGKYQLNLILSKDRAEIVHNYLNKILRDLDISRKDKIWLTQKISVLGMSSSELVYDINGIEDKVKSRRIEIQAVLKEKIVVEEKESNIEEEIKKVDHKMDDPNTIYLANYIRKLLVENPTLSEKYNFLKSIQKQHLSHKFEDFDYH